VNDADEQFAFGKDLSAAAVEMLATKKLSYYFTSIPPGDSLYIIVETPSYDEPSRRGFEVEAPARGK